MRRRVRRALGLLFVALAGYVVLVIVLNPEQVMGVLVVFLLVAIAQWLLTGTRDPADASASGPESAEPESHDGGPS